uniref:Serine/threonine-protein phosphatase 7 long form homolog n=1 Tax=Nicotiana tabacum TaxID=4097 RepID=A0A1S3ZYB2_TOBAC|nr:PREDICTED: serine/threonine-protein phosphatase 7 long form homolog [Nicotiana tabacum]
MDLSPVHPGPVEDQILVLQGDYMSSYVWEGHLLDQTLSARRPNDLWDFLRQRHFHPRVVERLEATGFLTIFRIGRMQFVWSLIMPLIERWRPEMHTFHLLTREATITLEDVEVLYGMHVDGLYTGYRPQGEAILRGGSRVSMTAIREHMELDELPRYSWGDAILAYLYRSICQAIMGSQAGICGFLPLLKVWAWQRILSLHPPLPLLETGVAPSSLPLATKWVLRRGNYRGTDAHHNLPLVRDVLDMLVAGQFIWMSYSDELLAQLPDYCSVDRLLWSTSVLMIFFNVVEHHAIERVFRQFHRPQTILGEPAWLPTHYQLDNLTRVDDASEATIELHTSWYHCHTRLMIRNPIHVLGDRYRPYAGRHEALVIGHHMFYQLGQEMQQHGDSAAVIEYARDGARLDHEAEYAAPEEYHQGRAVLRGRGRARSRGAPLGRGGRRGGGPQQGGIEAPVDPPVEAYDEDLGDEDLGDDQPGYFPQLDEPSSSMLSYNLQLSLPASRVTPSDTLLIMGTFDGNVDQFFSGSVTPPFFLHPRKGMYMEFFQLK